MAVTRKYRINLKNYGNPPSIMLSQYDEGYALVFEVYDGAQPAASLSAYTIKLEGIQPKANPADPDLKYEFAGTVSGTQNNILSFVIDTTMTGKAGKGVAEIAIIDSQNDVLFGLFNLPVYIEKAPVPNDAIDADVERAQEIAEQCEEIVEHATEGAEAWAVGTKGGVAVESTDPTYHNNSKYYAEQAAASASSGLTAEIKAALLACFRAVVWRGDVDADDLYYALDTALNPPANLSNISAVYTQSGTVDLYDSLESLRSDLVVTAHYTDNTSAVVTSYTLSGQLTLGTSTITVSYGGKTTTFDVTVTSSWDYVWDLTKSLTDTVGGVTAVASAGTGVEAPAITSSGLVFNAATQRLSLGDINLTGKTIEIDVESLDFKGSTDYHMRFLVNGTNVGPLVYKSGGGWQGYGLSSSGGSSAGWKAYTWIGTSQRTNRSLIDGVTVKLVNETDNTITLYIDGIAVASMTGMRYGEGTQDLAIGGATGYSQSAGDQCYDMVISAIRIKTNPSTEGGDSE